MRVRCSETEGRGDDTVREEAGDAVVSLAGNRVTHL